MPLFRRNLPNPGRLEELKKEAQSVLSPDVFEGARFEFNKSLTQKFALLHNVTLASGQPGAYEFGAHVGDERTLLASRVDMQGRLNGRVQSQVNDQLLVRVQATVAPEALASNTFKADVDYKGGDFCMGGYFMGGGLLGGSYMQSLTEGLSVGAECFYHTLNRKVRGGAGVARYVWGGNGENVATAKVGTFGNGAVEMAYQRKVSEKVALATEMQYYHNQFCQYGLGYEFKLRNAIFKGLISSDTTCSAVIEEHIQPGINLVLSGQLNHKKGDHKFGCGLTIGGS